MIWFTCKECGKKHGRPESSAGALTFCTCGHGNSVPWESTAEPDPVVIVDNLPSVPELAPMKFELEARPASAPSSRRPPPERRRPEPRLRAQPRDPKMCLNHPNRANQAACVDCGQGFCEDCLVTVEAKPLCGPCKNRRVKAMHLPPPNSQLAFLSILLALLAGALPFCLYAMGINIQARMLTLFALLPQFAAMTLGIWALHKLRDNRKQGGQALALSGILAAGFGMFWTVFLTLYGSRVWG